MKKYVGINAMGALIANIKTKFAERIHIGGQPHNNMPPYLAVYVWKRVA